MAHDRALSPTRSCLLTGRNHTRTAWRASRKAAIGFPNASGHDPPENGMLSEILGESGDTYAVGKWHLCPEDEMNVASTAPHGRPAAASSALRFLGAETSQWYPDLVYDNHPVDQPRSPEEGYHFTEDITDKAIEFISDAKAIAPEKPFFLYYRPRVSRAPITPDGVDRAYRGRFDMGYEAMREQDAGPPEGARVSCPPTRSSRRSIPSGRTKLAGPDGLPFPQTRRDVADGTPCRTTKSTCLRGWRSLAPDSSRTSTITSAPAPRLSRDGGGAREHDRDRGVRQRRKR